MAYRVPITVRLESFEGPLDLLLYLIQSHEMDISKVSITRITDQYLAYVRLMQELNFDIASEFLVMAATLLHWKSKAILPQEKDPNAPQDEDDAGLTQEELIRQLLEHQRFLAAGQDLNQLSLLGEDVFKRPIRRQPVERIWKEMDITTLSKTYIDLQTRARKRTTVLRKETVSIADKILEMKDRLKVGKLTPLTELLSAVITRPEIVATFLATLELGRLKKMKLYQEGVYTPILVELLEAIREADTELAVGFDAPAQQADEQKDKPKGLIEHVNEQVAKDVSTPVTVDLHSFGEDPGSSEAGAGTDSAAGTDASAAGAPGDARDPSNDGSEAFPVPPPDQPLPEQIHSN